jgi:hypothetical protein
MAERFDDLNELLGSLQNTRSEAETIYLVLVKDVNIEQLGLPEWMNVMLRTCRFTKVSQLVEKREHLYTKYGLSHFCIKVINEKLMEYGF